VRVEREWGGVELKRGSGRGFIEQERSTVVSTHGRRPWRSRGSSARIRGRGARSVAMQRRAGSGRSLEAATATSACRGAARGPNLAGAIRVLHCELSRGRGGMGGEGGARVFPLRGNGCGGSDVECRRIQGRRGGQGVAQLRCGHGDDALQ
jgi:hypothetical protein